MKKSEILKALVGIEVDTPLDETGSKILESLKNMEQVERLETLCDIIDDPRIDLDIEVMNKVLVNHRDELVALRKATSYDNTDVSSETTAERAVELLNA